MLRASEDHLWAKAAELERDFAGYKRRIAERRAHAVAEAAAGRAGGGEDEEEERAGDAAAGRGRRYEEYVRRRDERLRQEWRARMERKEAEVQALWARLDRTGSRSRRGGGVDGELAAAATGARAREVFQDQVKPQQKPGNLVVKATPPTPVTPRGNPGHPAAKLARPRTSAPPSSSLAAASPRLSTPDPRRRPSHLHREQQPAEPRPPATPRKENRLPPPPPSTALAAASPATTPRPRTAVLSRSRSMFKDRGSGSVAAARESPSPRPPRFHPPRSSNLKEPTPPPRAEAVAAVVQSSSCSREEAVIADRKKASAVAPEPFPVRRSCNGVDITPAGGGNADPKNNKEYVHQSSDKFGSVEITGDSDTEPSYVYIKKDRDEQIPRPPQASPGLGTCPGPEPRSGDEDGDNVDDAMESTGSNEVAGGETAAADEEDEFRRESSESLYSNVPSSFSDSTVPSAADQSPESSTSPWTTTRKSTEMEEAEKRRPSPTTPRSSTTVPMAVQSPMDAVNGLKRLLTFGKRNGKTSEAAAATEQRASRPVIPAPPAGDDGSVAGQCRRQAVRRPS